MHKLTIVLAVLCAIALAGHSTATMATDAVVHEVDIGKATLSAGPSQPGMAPVTAPETDNPPFPEEWQLVIDGFAQDIYTTAVCAVDDLMWVTSGGGNTNPAVISRYYLSDRTLHDRFNQPYSTNSWGMLDMAYDPVADEVYSGVLAGSRLLLVIDGTTGALIGSARNVGSPAPTTLLSMARDEHDSLYTAFFNDNPTKFYHTAPHGPRAFNFQMPTDHTNFGKAIDIANGYIWSYNEVPSTADPKLVRQDWPSLANREVFPVTGASSYGGGADMWGSEFLLVLDQNDPKDIVRCLRVGAALANDVGVSAILAPTGTIEPGNVTPRVTVRNFGSVAQSNIPVYIVIDEGGTPVYSEDLTHPGPLDPGATVDVSFTPDWNATEGNYGVTSWTLLPGDENPANDTMRGTVQVSSDNLVWYARTPAPAPARYWSPGHGAVRDTIYFLGGRQADAFSIRTIFAYDVANATWITSGLPNLLTPRRAGAGGRIGNKIYAAGGRDSAHTTLSTLEEFDVDAKTVVSRAAMPSAAWACFGAVAGDKLYVIGSETYAGITREYDPVGDAWATRATLAPGRGWAAAVGYDGKVYVTGGSTTGNVTLSDCWVFDPVANTWSPLANMPGPRIYHMMVADGEGSIYVLGGASDGAGSADQLVYRYDIVADAWSVETPMITARGWAMANVVGGSIWVAYGSDCSTPTYLLHLEEGVLPIVGMEEYRPVSVGGTALRVAGLVRDFATVRFNLARSGRARLNVYDISGKLVRTLASGVFEAGEHVATWDRTDDTGRLVANGTYFYRLTVEGRTVAAKSVVLN